MTAPITIPGAALLPLAFSEIAGWAEDDHAAALGALRRSCDAILARERMRGGPAREALEPAMLRVCETLAQADAADARTLIEAEFAPYRILPDGSEDTARAGFVTAYFEPVVPGARQRTARFS
ncbi:MAG: lytic transglycosylase, partial [Pseudomonadota bacterium]